MRRGLTSAAPGQERTPSVIHAFRGCRDRRDCGRRVDVAVTSLRPYLRRRDDPRAIGKVLRYVDVIGSMPGKHLLDDGTLAADGSPSVSACGRAP